MIVTTTDIIQGAEIQSYLGIVTAEVVYGTNALRDFFAGIRDIIGGRTGSYEEVFLKGQRDALAELEKRAQRLGFAADYCRWNGCKIALSCLSYIRPRTFLTG